MDNYNSRARVIIEKSDNHWGFVVAKTFMLSVEVNSANIECQRAGELEIGRHLKLFMTCVWNK